MVKEPERESYQKRHNELELCLLDSGGFCWDMMVVFKVPSDGKGMWLISHDCEWKVSNRTIQQQDRLTWGEFLGAGVFKQVGCFWWECYKSNQN